MNWRDCIIRSFMISTHQMLLGWVNKEEGDEQGVFHMWAR